MIIAAKSANDVIGIADELPWHLPADQRFFRQQVRQGYLLTGRTSFESPLGRELLAGRQDVLILTRQANYTAPPALVVHSVEEAFQTAEEEGAALLWVLGGADVYLQTINQVDELVLTEIHTVVEGDRFFPAIDPALWEEVSRLDYPSDSSNPYPYSFVHYRRQVD